MKIIELKTSEIKPYEKNPRRNDESVDLVAESIRNFGFKSPIIVDKDNVIVCGHTRLKAAEKLNLKKVPCIIADDLTPEQVKAYRLADNKVSEFSEWDYDLLDSEIGEILDIDMTDFGFEFVEATPEEDEPKENERLRTDNAYNLSEFDSERTEGFYQMPIIKGTDHVPSELIGFNYALTSDNVNAGIHFYVDDYQFERIWNDPKTYIKILSKFDCVLTPDFSLYLDMPISMKIWNTYRSRLIGQMMQDYGLTVIPTVSWAEKETFDFCFDGLPKNSVLSISTVGVKRDSEAIKIWKSGMDELIERKSPSKLIVYGGKIDYDYGNIEVVHISNSVTERMKNAKN